MSNSKPQSELHQLESNADKLSKRRRAFIKGSAAVLPVVLTLRNGSAFAAESISCLAKQANITPQPITPAPDGYVRDQIVYRSLKGNGLKLTVYEYPAGSGKWFPDTENSGNEAASYVMVSGTTNKMVQFATTTPQYTAGSTVLNGHILAQLKPDGTRIMPLQVGPKGSNQNAIVTTNSCMTSLAN